jgi:hypothetical protein
MAVDIIDDPNKQKDANGQQAGSTNPDVGGASSSGGSSNSQQSSNNRTGSGFVNLQNILQANKTNKLGSTVGSGIQNAANDVKQGLNTAQSDFQQQSNQNQMGNTTDQQNRSSIINRITGNPVQVNTVGQGPNPQPQAASSAPPSAATPPAPSASSDMVSAGGNANFNEMTGQPTNAQPATQLPSVSDDEAAQFAKYRSGSYAGPQELANLNALQGQASQAQQLGANTTTAGGQQQLLQQFIGQGPQYTSGMRGLDSLILGQTGGNELNAARQSTSGLSNDVNGANSLAQQIAQSNTAQAKQFGLDTTNQLGNKNTGAIGDIYSGLNKTVTDKQNAADAQFNPLMQRINSGALTKDDETQVKNLLGLDPNGPIYGSKDQIMQALTTGIKKGQYDTSNVADQQQNAKINALQKLSGQNDTNLDQSRIGTAGAALTTDQSVRDQLAKIQEGGASRFNNDYKNAGILSQKELDYINSKDVQDQFHNIGGIMNSVEQQDAEGRVRGNNQIDALQKQIASELSANDTTNNESGFNQYMPMLNGTGNANTDLGNYGGTRTWARSEGVSAFLANLSAQQQKRQGIEQNNNYSQNLGSLLGYSDKNLKKNIKDGDKHVESFLDTITPHQYEYNSPEHGLGKHLGIMAQDLEKTDEGRQAIIEKPEGKQVNFGKLGGMILASQANIHNRLKAIESNKKKK